MQVTVHHTRLPKYPTQTGTCKLSLGAPTTSDELSAANGKTKSVHYRGKADKSHHTVPCLIAIRNNFLKKKKKKKTIVLQNKHGAELGNEMGIWEPGGGGTRL